MTMSTESEKPKPQQWTATLYLLLMLGGVLGGVAGLAGFLGSEGKKVDGWMVDAGAAIAAFTTVLVFLPNRYLSSDSIASIIGTKNPWASRVVCLIAAALFWGFAIAKYQGM